MDTPKSKKLAIVIPAFRWHSQAFLNVLEGITEEDAQKRIEDKTNHLGWMVGNFVNMRYGLGGVLGLKEQDPFDEIFFQGKALSKDVQYPTLEALKKNFHTISPLVYQSLLDATDEQLDAELKMGMESSFYEENVLNFVGMCIGREDYLAGQMGLMRRWLGYEGMSYDVNETLKY